MALTLANQLFAKEIVEKRFDNTFVSVFIVELDARKELNFEYSCML